MSTLTKNMPNNIQEILHHHVSTPTKNMPNNIQEILHHHVAVKNVCHEGCGLLTGWFVGSGDSAPWNAPHQVMKEQAVSSNLHGLPESL